MNGITSEPRPRLTRSLGTYGFAAICLMAFSHITASRAEDQQGSPIPGLLQGVETTLDLSHWKLTLPVNANGELSADDDAVEIVNLNGTSLPPYFDVRPDWITFMAPTNGARTNGSHYPRSELREMDGSGNEYEWLPADGGRLAATLRVDELPKVAGSMQSRIVVGQIHGPNDELCRLYYDAAGNLYFVDDKAGAKQTETVFQLQAPDGGRPKVPLGEKFSYEIIVDDLTLTVSVTHGGRTYTASDHLSAFWPDKPLYFKAGAYVQVGPRDSEAMNQGEGRGSSTFFEISRPTHDVYNYAPPEEDDSMPDDAQAPDASEATDEQIYAGCLIVMSSDQLGRGLDYADAISRAATLCEDVNEDFDPEELQQIGKIVDSILRPTG